MDKREEWIIGKTNFSFQFSNFPNQQDEVNLKNLLRVSKDNILDNF